MSDRIADIAGIWLSWMGPMSLQVTVLIAMVVAVDRVFARWAWPGLLNAVWMLIILRLLLPPTMTSPVSVTRLLFEPVANSPSAGLPSSGPTVGTIALFACWAAGCLALSAIAFARYRRLKRRYLNDSAHNVPDWLVAMMCRLSDRLGLKKVPRLVIATNDCGPAVVGFLRPVVVLPAGCLSDSSRERVEHALLHELAHVRRRDPLWTLVCLLVQLAYWFHPLVWLTCRRLSTLRELGCDERVVHTLGSNADSYRSTLLDIARARLEPAAGGAIGMFGARSQLLTRLQWIERMPVEHSKGRAIVTMAAVSLLTVCCVPLARPTYAKESSPAMQNAPADTPDDIAGPPANPAVDSEQLADVRLQDLQGSLQVRYAVLGMLAGQSASGGANLSTTSAQGAQP